MEYKQSLIKQLGCKDCIGRYTNCPGPENGNCPELDEDCETEDIRDWNDMQHDLED